MVHYFDMLACKLECLRVCDVPLNALESVYAILNADKVCMCDINADRSSENVIAIGSLHFSFLRLV